MSNKITVTTKAEAWEAADKIFPTDYEKDYASSERAGYDIYRHRELNPLTRICDLGNRLEVLTGEHGENVVNIWIEPEIIKGIGTNMSQSDYMALADDTNRAPSTDELTEEQAKILVNEWFGFEASRIEIISEVKTYIKDGRYIKEYQTFDRKPQYAATDWNYVRFNVNNWYYEMINGQLYPYYC